MSHVEYIPKLNKILYPSIPKVKGFLERQNIEIMRRGNIYAIIFLKKHEHVFAHPTVNFHRIERSNEEKHKP